MTAFHFLGAHASISGRWHLNSIRRCTFTSNWGKSLCYSQVRQVSLFCVRVCVSIYKIILWFTREFIRFYFVCRILEKGKELVSLLLSCNAHVYICGDGNQMAKDVTNALIFILQKHGDLSEERAQEFLEDMRCRRRLLMDVWS